MGRKKQVFLSLFLSACFIIGLVFPTKAANENNIMGVTFEAILDKPTLEVSSQDQTVVMTVNSSKPIVLEGIGADVIWDSSLVLLSIENLDQRIDFAGAVNVQNGRIRWDGTDTLAQLENVYNLAVVTFIVPANTPSGTYTIGMDNIELCKDYGTIWESGATVSATLTITEKSILSGDVTNDGVVDICDLVRVKHNIGHVAIDDEDGCFKTVDFNNNGQIDEDDVKEMRRLLVTRM